MFHRYQSNGIELVEDDFDVLQTGSNSIKIKRFTWKNSSNVSVQVITYGATITSIKLPDKNGAVDDVVLGFNNIQGKLSRQMNLFKSQPAHCLNLFDDTFYC